jgi:3-methyladenine DNA glycosylase AlkD
VIESIQQVFHSASNAELAVPMARYMRNQFLFLGIPSPQRREISKGFRKEVALVDEQELNNVVTGLFSLPEREFSYLALDILQQHRRPIPQNRIHWLEKLAVHRSWWDTIDPLATQHMGAYFQQWPEDRVYWITRWKASGNFWLQRCAILFQLKYKANTDKDMLHEILATYASSDEFFLQKAIGWALREYAKTNPDWVRKTLATGNWKSLSKREALRHIKA